MLGEFTDSISKLIHVFLLASRLSYPQTLAHLDLLVRQACNVNVVK